MPVFICVTTLLRGWKHHERPHSNVNREVVALSCMSEGGDRRQKCAGLRSKRRKGHERRFINKHTVSLLYCLMILADFIQMGRDSGLRELEISRSSRLDIVQFALLIG